MPYIDIEKVYKSRLDGIWAKGPTPVIHSGYAIEKVVPRNALLFVSMNPSNDGSRGRFFIDISIASNPFFAAIKNFYGEIKKSLPGVPPLAHHDLLFVRETNQKTMQGWMKVKGNKGFFDAQLDISKEVIKNANPQMIVVLNAGAKVVFEDLFGIAPFCDTLGAYMYSINGPEEGKTPVLFSGMLSGQRSLDLGSRKSLEWHIGYVLKQLSSGTTLC